MATLEDDSFHSVKSHFIHSTEKLEWVPLSLTFVEYPQGDPVGKVLALISLTPFAIITGFITLVLFRRDLHTITFFGGIVINEAVNLLLKHTICEARPMKRDSLYTEYGMPSTHAQTMWFFAAYVMLFICIRLHYNNNSTVSERFWRISIIAGCVILASLVTYSRVYLMYHTVTQVVCGTIVGIVLGITWFMVTHLILTPFFPIIVSCNELDGAESKLIGAICSFIFGSFIIILTCEGLLCGWESASDAIK